MQARTLQFLRKESLSWKLALRNWRLENAGPRCGLLGLYIAKLIEDAFYLFFLQFTNQETGQWRVRTIIFSEIFYTVRKNWLANRWLMFCHLALNTHGWVRNKRLGRKYCLPRWLIRLLNVFLSLVKPTKILFARNFNSLLILTSLTVRSLKSNFALTDRHILLSETWDRIIWGRNPIQNELNTLIKQVIVFSFDVVTDFFQLFFQSYLLQV